MARKLALGGEFLQCRTEPGFSDYPAQLFASSLTSKRSAVAL
jgi:hypothetical protein